MFVFLGNVPLTVLTEAAKPWPYLGSCTATLKLSPFHRGTDRGLGCPEGLSKPCPRLVSGRAGVYPQVCATPKPPGFSREALVSVGRMGLGVPAPPQKEEVERPLGWGGCE